MRLTNVEWSQLRLASQGVDIRSSDRPSDRARSKLKRLGLLVYERAPTARWRITDLGRAALATLQPSGERREAIARALAEKWPGDYMQGDDECEREPNALAYETADAAILASGLVQDEAAIRADERERIAKSVECDCCDVCGESPGFPKCANEIAAAIRSARNGGAS